ncbi:hypothetical protein H4582DRAFT_2049618 [Lactarius indigo]|nr:hypothetical protein H4582DRAFT_2049618 [Lactarius indigo]
MDMINRTLSTTLGLLAVTPRSCLWAADVTLETAYPMYIKTSEQAVSVPLLGLACITRQASMKTHKLSWYVALAPG